MSNPLSKENIQKNLLDAGCDIDVIEKFLEYRQKEGTSKQILFLKCQRCQLLEGLHQVQKSVDCLDYLIYMIKKEEESHEK